MIVFRFMFFRFFHGILCCSRRTISLASGKQAATLLLNFTAVILHNIHRAGERAAVSGRYWLPFGGIRREPNLVSTLTFPNRRLPAFRFSRKDLFAVERVSRVRFA